MTTDVCVECGRPAKASRCFECRQVLQAEQRVRSGEAHLPPREPDPVGIPFCACGAITNVVAFGSEVRCAECWRNAA